MGKRIGRPVVPGTPGERVPVGFRITAEAKLKLEQAALASGRSLSQEAELRIEQSFERDFILKSLRMWAKKELKR
jgi:hypothetical protein